MRLSFAFRPSLAHEFALVCLAVKCASRSSLLGFALRMEALSYRFGKGFSLLGFGFWRAGRYSSLRPVTRLADTMLGTDAVDRLLGDHPSRVSAFHAAARTLQLRAPLRPIPVALAAKFALGEVHGK